MPVSVSSLKVNTEEKAMSTVMLGTEVAKTMKEELIRDVELLKGKGIHPCLAIIRVGSPEEMTLRMKEAQKNVWKW